MILIAFGANVPSPAGAPSDTIRAALRALPGRGVTLLADSPFYASAAWPDPADPPFVNAVAQVASEQGPEQLLSSLRQMERAFGRVSGRRNAPRPLDIDLLDFHGLIQEGPPVLPHPRMAERGFVLVPLRDIAPHWRHPVLGAGVSELIAHLPLEAAALRTLA